MADPGDEELAQELADLRARYRTMVELAPDPIVIFDLHQGRFVEANHATCELFGMTRDQLLQTSPAQMSPPTQPDGRPSSEAVVEHVKRAMRDEVTTFEWTHRSAEGEPLPCRVQLTRIEVDGRQLFRGAMLDLRTERGVAEARDRFRGILDATTDLVGMGDAQGRTLYVNPAARRALGVPDDIHGAPITRYLTPESAKVLEEVAIPTAVRDGSWLGETEFEAPDGRRIPTSQVLIAHLDQQGNLQYLSTIARDLTERRALELQALHAQKLDSLGLMAGGVAHDFNNILVAILGNLELLRQEAELDASQHELLEAAITASGRAAGLAREMLAYSGKAQIDLESVEISKLLREITNLLAASVSKKSQLRFEFGQDVPPVWGDPTQLQQILMNLVLNASEALDDVKSEIRVSISVSRADAEPLLHSYLDDGPADRQLVCCEVTDSGQGMPPELVHRVFDPFFSTKFTGRGLGLAAVLGIVKAHRGAIAVRTAPGEGTTFRLLFPAADPTTETVTSSPPQRAAQREGEGTVLVVDDEPSVRMVARRTLERAGFTVIEAEDGAVAVNILREQGSRLAAVLLDMTMPGLDGREVLAMIRADLRAVPVIMMSGYPNTETPQADAFLGKPFRPQALLEALQGVLAETSR